MSLMSGQSRDGRALQSPRVRAILGFSAMGLWLLTAAMAWHTTVIVQHGYHLFDWLISYDAGLVRRGLAGEVVESVDGVLPGRLPHVVWTLQVVAYGAILQGAYHLARAVHVTPALALLLVSPAVFTFHVYDPAGGFRKEILPLALLAQALAFRHRWDRKEQPARAFAVLPISLLLLAVLVLAHEVSILVLPFLFVIGGGSPWTTRRRLAVVAGMTAVAAALAVVALHPGSADHVAALCNGLRASLEPSLALSLCESRTSVAWLQLDLMAAIRTVGQYAWGPGLLSLSVALPLVLVGIVPAFRETARARPEMTPWLRAMVVAGALVTIPMFAVALDWGRFVAMWAMCMTLAILYVRAFVGPVPAAARAPESRFIAAFAPVYATVWNLEHAQILIGLGILDSIL